MICIDVITQFLADYVEGRLPAETRADFEKHIAGCRSCAAYLASYRETMAMAAAAHRAPLRVEDVPEDLVAAILKVAR